jgi:hypothetical protein
MSDGGDHTQGWGNWTSGGPQPSPPAEPATAAPAYGNFGAAGAEQPLPGRTKRRLPLLIAGLAAALIAVLAVVVPYGGAKTPQATVVASVNNAVASKTARASLSMTAGSGQVTGNGFGVIDFSNGAMDMQMNVHVGSAAESLAVHLIYFGGTIYEGLPQVSQLIPGKSWVSLDLSSLLKTVGGGSPLDIGGNPAAMLRLLGEHGNTVVPIGGSNIGGTSVNGYRVDLDPATIEREIASANLPSWMRDAVSQVNLQNATETVYIDSSGRFRRTTTHVTMNGPAGKSFGLDETLDLSNYGVPVSISPPPADQVIDFQQFLQQIQNSNLG